MAFCGKCGHKNNDDALFCGACGAPLKKADDATAPPRWERLHLQREEEETPHGENATTRNESMPPRRESIPPRRESVPPRRESVPPRRDSVPPRRDSVPPRREKSAGAWADMAEKRKNAEKQPEKKKKKGCLKRILWWMVGFLVVIFASLWAIGKCSEEGTDGETDNQDPTTFERVMSQASVDSLVAAQGFPKTNDDVAPLAGDYEVTAQGYAIMVTLTPAQDGKVVGKVIMKAGDHTAVSDGVYCYCGNSKYAIYKYDTDVEKNKVRNYFYAMPDRKSIMMIDGDEYILKRKEVKPVKKASSGLLSKDYERSFDDARFEKLRNRHEFPISTVDVSLQPGEYTTHLEKDGVKGDVYLKIEPNESDNKQIIGRAEFGARVEGKGENSQSLTVTYAGNSVYALYPEDMEIGSLDGMVLYVSPDSKTLDLYERGEIVMSFKR